MTMGNDPLPKDISKPDRIEGMMPVGGSDNPRESDESFRSLMQKNTALPKEGQTVKSPFDLARGASPLTTGPTIGSIQAQVVHTQTSLGDLANTLTTPNLKLKPSSKYLLRNKLSEASQQLRTVNAKVSKGEEQTEEEELPAGTGPIQKLLSYVSTGQASLAAAQQHIQKLAEDGENLSPAELLLVQVKLNKAQQLIEYSSVLVSKAVDDMKQLFNIQL